MPRSGQTLVHPTTGQRLTFVRTGQDSAGAELVLHSVLPAGSPRPPPHVHPHQEERFIPLEGSLRGWVGRRRVVVRPGEVLVVPPGVPHTLGGEGRLRWEFRPALRTGELLEAVVGVAVRRGALVRGLPRPLPLAAVLRGFQAEIRLALVPPVLQRALLAALGRVGEQRRGRP
ncbi:MAG: cupin domain-containing protein [Actinomycetota bacterium]|nr:cupin domain-containing protein [Actinomycetota bacterium]